MSRIAILTGLTRKEVQGCWQTVDREDRYGEEYNRAARVITGWLRDPDLETATATLIRFAWGESGVYSVRSKNATAETFPCAPCLDQLIRVGAVK
ncbi:MAG TPA: DUF6502 family protein [Nitrospira sp.]|jgi:hypothetical protein